MKRLALTAAIAASAILTAGALAAAALAEPAVTGHAINTAATAPVTRGQCFFTRDIKNHTLDGDKVIYLDVQGRGVFKVTTSNSCAAGHFSSDPLVIRNFNGSSSICHPIDFDVGIAQTGAGGFETRCIVQSIALMAPAEVAALPKKLRP